MKTSLVAGCSLAVVLALSACAHAPADDPADPLEKMNRKVFAFNDKADRYVLLPIGRGYVRVVPQPVRTGVGNFLDNLHYPITIINDALQGKFKQSAADTGRFVLNSTAGLAGILDVATPAGLAQHDEDFGQTLGVWGVGEGWFLMLPLLGPSDNRDLVGTVADLPMSPTYWLVGRYDWVAYTIAGVDAVNKLPLLVDTYKIMEQQLDQYVFMRTSYLQYRQAQVYDGHPPPEDYGIEDDPAAPAKKSGTP